MAELRQKRGVLRALLALPLMPIRLLVFAGASLRWWRWRRRVSGPSRWLFIELEGSVKEAVHHARAARWLRQIFGGKRNQEVVLADLRELLRRMKQAPPAGIVLELGPIRAGWRSALELRQIVSDMGQIAPVHARIRSTAGNQATIIATAAAQVSASPSAHLSPVGAASTAFFFKDALAALGVTIETSSRGRYKSAIEPFNRLDRSDADREQTTALVQAIDEQMIGLLAGDRKIDREQALALIDGAPYTGASALEAGLIDRVQRQDEQARAVLEPASDGPKAKKRLVKAERVLAGPAKPELRLWPHRRRKVGLVMIEGAIIDEASPAGYSQDQAVENAVIDDLRTALDDDELGAIVLYVDSRGGSVTASDAIYGAVQRLDESKPVVACFGDYAASGGYYVACGARAIVASPLSITGSIGVFQALPNAAALFERARLHFDTIQSRARADFISPWRPLREDERTHLQSSVDRAYDEFVSVVARARKLDEARVRQVAEGRVWTGAQALEQGLVDGLGGMKEAIARAQEAAGGLFFEVPELVVTPMRKSDRLPTLPPSPEAAWLGLGLQLVGAGEEGRVLRELVALLSSARATGAWYYDPLSVR